MFSHIVVFWTKDDPQAAEKLAEAAHRLLQPIPGILSFHVGRMVPSSRSVVDQSYQVALNLTFANKKAEEEYQVHPRHIEFVENYFKPLCTRVVIYDFV